jgi:UDP-N-acetylmuramoyl-L-alanyl-D-glutamate--2,6-diaminopimelate ligase
MAAVTDEIKKMISSGAENLSDDSRRIRPGDVFVAVRGYSADGHDYVTASLEKGASLAVCEHEVPGIPSEYKEKIVIVKDTRQALADIVKEVFGDPSSEISVYGVTGTNGKSTTVFLVESVLVTAGSPCGMISTVYNKVKGSSLVRSSMTTPGIIEVNRMLREMVSDGKQAASVEISSHALHQNRVREVSLDAAVFTNITPEHLDYHGDMSSYLDAKTRIFDLLKPGGVAALNNDDPLVRGLLSSLRPKRLITFGTLAGSDVTCSNILCSPDGTECDLILPGGYKTRLASPLVGCHNVYNMLAAAAALYGTGMGPDKIKDGLEKARPVPGRLEAVVSNAPFRVFVDYAHTPDALGNVLGCLRPMTGGDLICVFGCGGDRDSSKRPVMGKIASKICDRLILTSDNPRTEDADKILAEIQKGVPAEGNYSIIKDRREAIFEALSSAGRGDIVVIAGKGHEDRQIIGDEAVHFDDREVAREILHGLGSI